MRLLRALLVIFAITDCIAQSSYVTLIVTNSGPPLTNFQLKFTLTAFGTLSGNFNSMRVYVEGQQTPVPQWIEDPTVSTNAVVWVKVPSLTNNMVLTVTDGNPVSSNNPDDVFELFDNFDGTALNSSKWVIGANQYTKNGRTAISGRISANCNAGIAGAAVANQGLIQTIKGFSDFYIEFGFYVYGATGCCSCPLATFKLKGGCNTAVESYHMRFDTGFYGYGPIVDGNYNILASGKSGRTLTPIASYGQNYNVDTELVMDGDRFLPAVFYEVRIQLIGKQVTHYLKGALTGNVWELQNTYGSSSQSFSTPSQPISFNTMWGGILILDYIRLSKASTQTTSVSAQSSAMTLTCNAGFTRPDAGPCTACVAGKYKTTSGSAACTDCGAGTYSTSTGATLAATCLVCPINTFSRASASSCQPCQANAVSAVGSVSQEYCYCQSGYAHVAGSYACRICDPGTYNSHLGRMACSNCSVGLYSVHYGAVGSETCLSCPLGQWSPEGSPNCNLCPVNSFAGPGSGSQTNCNCNAGYTGPNGDLCSACAAGQYKNATGADTCVSCPVGFTSPNASSSVSNCTCSPGYVNIADVCTAVITRAVRISGTLTTVTTDSSPGDIAAAMSQFRYQIAVMLGIPVELVQIERTYLNSGRALLSTEITIVLTISARSTTELSTVAAATADLSTIAGLSGASQTIVEGTTALSNLTCSACPANSYYAQGQCVSCMNNTVSVPGSLTCQCNAGFTGTAGACQACPAGTYKRMAGSSACRSCQPNSWSQSGSALCACNAGYTGNTGDVCVACVSGKYKNVTGPAACSDCAGNRNSGAGAPNVTSCICNAGYTQVENAAVSYDVVYAQACVGCEFGKFKGLTGVQACTTCAQNQSAVIASTICSCVAGFTGPDGGPCAECAQGKYKNWLGSQPCTTCPVNTDTAAIGSALLVNCTCNTGYTGPDGVACVACVAGMYKDVMGSSACATCPADTYSTLTIAAPSCTACNPGFKSFVGSSIVADCCDPNTTNARSPYYMLSSATQTQISQTSTLRYSGQIIPTYVVRVSSVPMLSFSPGTDIPPIPPTYISSGGYNGQAFLRFSKISSVSGVNYLSTGCIVRPDDGITIVTVVRFLESIKGVFWSMFGSYGSNAIEINLSDTLQLCVKAREGHWGDYSVCTSSAVPINVWLQVSYTYHRDRWPRTMLNVIYLSTIGNTVTLSGVGYSFILRDGGTIGVRSAIGYSTSGTCAGPHTPMIPSNNPVCDRPNFDLAGFYFIHTLASDADIAVLLGAIATGSQIYYDRSNSCPCNAGFGGTGRSDCKTCAPGSYKSEVSSSPCSLCPANMYSFAVQAVNVSTCETCPEGTVSMAGEIICFCAAGLTGPNFGPCELCEAGKFKNWRNSSECVGCPPNSDSVPGTSLCPCNVGYTGPLGGPCVACVAGKYKDTNGTALCTTCPSNSYEPDVAATTVTNCTCNTGYDGADGGPCVACVVGKYKSTNGSTSCEDCAVNTYSDMTARAVCSVCPALTVSLLGSTSIWSCQCTLGYTGPGGSGYFINNMARACGLNSNDACLSAGFSLLVSGNAGMSAAVDLSYSTGGAWRYVSGMSGAFAGINFGVERDVTTVSVYQGAANLKLYVGNLYSPYTSNTPCSSVSTWESPWRLYTCGKRGQYLYFEQPDTALNLELTEISVSGYVVGDACTACGSGRYKSSVGPSDCTACDVNTYSEVVNATSIATCLTCQGNSTSVQASPSKLFCQCNVGFLHDGEECEMCSPGTYNSQLGRTACSKCSMGLYSVNYQATDNETCLSCPAGQWSPEGSSVCMLCPENSAAPPGMGRIVDCACNVGYTGPGGGPCAQCEVGKYKNFTGSWPCVMCPAYTSSPLASVNLGDCFCIPGFSGANGLPCTACGIGKYKAVSGTSSCQLCPVNTYSDSVGFSVCTACVSSSASVSGSTSIWNCTCNAGYTGPTYTGVQRNTNFARSCGDGSQACPTLQSSTFVDETADMAVDGTTLTRSNTMFASNQWWRVDFGRRVTIVSVLIFFSQHTSDTLVVHVGDDEAAGANSICSSVNFYGTADDWKTVNCSVARTGRYLHVRNTVGGVLGLREIQPIGSEVVPILWPGFCEACKPGFFKNSTGNQVCSPCSANTFSNVTAARSAQTCLPCVSNMMSAAGSVSCDCDVGFTAEAGVCVSCAFGKFKSAVGSEACTPCPVRSIALSNSRETCACEEGYEATWLNS
jgi:hypothetical protein